MGLSRVDLFSSQVKMWLCPQIHHFMYINELYCALSIAEVLWVGSYLVLIVVEFPKDISNVANSTVGDFQLKNQISIFLSHCGMNLQIKVHVLYFFWGYPLTHHCVPQELFL